MREEWRITGFARRHAWAHVYAAEATHRDDTPVAVPGALLAHPAIPVRITHVAVGRVRARDRSDHVPLRGVDAAGLLNTT